MKKIYSIMFALLTIHTCLSMHHNKKRKRNSLSGSSIEMFSQYHSIGFSNKREYRKASLAMKYITWFSNQHTNAKNQRANYNACLKYLNYYFKQYYDATISDDEESLDAILEPDEILTDDYFPKTENHDPFIPLKKNNEENPIIPTWIFKSKMTSAPDKLDKCSSPSISLSSSSDESEVDDDYEPDLEDQKRRYY